MVISKKTIIFQGFRGGWVQHFPWVGGLNASIKYVIFQGAPEPLSHLWTHECILLT